jgi:hypothetical protein
VIPNAGQTDPAVRFEARAGDGAVFFTRREIVLARPSGALRLRFDGASAHPAVTAADRAPGVVNDLRGSDRGRWRTGLPTYDSVVYRGLYPGVDLRMATEAQAGRPALRATYTVAPGADADAIRWRYAGASARMQPRTGELRVVSGAGAAAMTLAAPVAWQEAGGARVPVEARYAAGSAGAVGIALGRHDRASPVMLSVAPAHTAQAPGPPGLRYSTFLGGPRWDEAYEVAVDKGGNAVAAGFTFSPEFPRAGARASAFTGVVDAFVTKLDADGRLVYSTLLGGDAADYAHSVAVDARGNAYVTGRTESEDFPTQAALQRKIRGRRCQGSPCHDAFVSKLDARGALVYSTYLGGTGTDEAWDIAVDSAGGAHVIGHTDSLDYPTRRAVQRRHGSRPCGGDVPCPFDAFVTKLKPNGRALAFSTYLGGRAGELAGAITVGSKGNAYVHGTTDSPNFPLRNPLQGALRGTECGPPPNVPCEDVFVAKFAKRGKRLVWSTLLGGSKEDRASGIAVDPGGRVYLTGATESSDFPTATPVQAAPGNSSCSPEAVPKESCDDAFVAGLSANGKALRFSTYLGGNAQDQGLAIALDKAGGIHVAGSTDSRQFPVVNAFQGEFGGAIDGFAALYSPDGRAVSYITYLGGEENERVNGLAVDPSGQVTLTGRTESADFPVANALQPTLSGDIDAFVAKLTR